MIDIHHFKDLNVFRATQVDSYKTKKLWTIQISNLASSVGIINYILSM